MELKVLGKFYSTNQTLMDVKRKQLNLQLKTEYKFEKNPFYYALTDLSKIRTYKKNIDKPIDVLYDAKNPEKFVIGRERNFNSFSLIFATLVGLIFLTIGVCSILGIINVEF